MQSKATTVAAYLDSLPADRRRAIEAIRKVIRANLDPRFEEGMQYGMIGYYVPHSVFPDGYHCDPEQPLPYAGLASQKNHMSVYMMSAYMNSEQERWLKTAWTKAGKKLDMGKCCIRFKKLEDVPLDVLGEAFARVGAQKWIDVYRSALDSRGQRPSTARKSAARKSTSAKSAGAKSAVKKATKNKPARKASAQRASQRA